MVLKNYQLVVLTYESMTSVNVRIYCTMYKNVKHVCLNCLLMLKIKGSLLLLLLL